MSTRTEGWRNVDNLVLAYIVMRTGEQRYGVNWAVRLRDPRRSRFIEEPWEWIINDCPEENWRRIEAPWRLRDREPTNELVKAFELLLITEGADVAYRFFESRIG